MASNDHSRLHQISQIVTEALLYADVGEEHYKRFLQLAFNGIRELKRGVIRESVHYLKVTPDAINRVNFPQDMEEFIGVGIPYGGRLWLLTERKDIIATYTEADDGSLSLDTNDGEGVPLPTAQYENILSTGGVNLYGYFKVDWEQEEIIFNAATRGEYILVYTTSGIRVDAITYIPTRAKEALLAYILWKDALGRLKTTADIPIVQARKVEWLEERSRLKRRDLLPSVQEFWDVLNSTKSLLRR